MYLTLGSNRRVNLKNESGMMIVQVVIMSVILLGVLLAGFKTVQTTIQVSNTTATSAAFKDLVLNVQQSLAGSNTCTQRLFGMPINGVKPLAAVMTASNTANGHDLVRVRGPGSLNLPALVEKESATSTSPRTSEFKITEVKLRNVRAVGWNNGGRPGGVNNHAAELTIVAERRAGFLGGKTMTAQIPLLLGVYGTSPPMIRNCTTRNLYQAALGPGTAAGRKTGLECIDRGGVPILLPAQGSTAAFYVCRLPAESLISCTATLQNSIPGWNCYRPTIYDATTRLGYTYVY